MLEIERYGRTMSPIVMRSNFHPVFSVSTSHGASPRHECPGITKMPTTADRTDPKEKKTESAVTMYCFPFGMCSRRSVPSVGIEPYRI